MRNVFFSIAYSFLTIIGLFSNLTFAATVTTGEATNVTSNSATLNGIVSNSRSPSEWFEYGTASGSYDNSTRTTSVFPFAGTKTVSIEVCGLSASKTYYYRIAAYENTPGGPSFYPDAYGEEKSFTTLAETTPIPMITPTQSPGLSPVVETGEVEVYETSAILNGTVNANEWSTTTWFEYGTVSAAYTDVTSKQTICGSSNISVSIRTGKLPNSFFYRITAQNDAGTSYGNEKFFTSLATPILTITQTPSATPTATVTSSPTSTPCVNMETGDATDITSNSATLNAIVCFGTTANYMYFEYGTISGEYTNNVSAEREGMSDNVSAKISELSPKTTYYYRIAIQQKPVPPSSGYVYGEEKYFTTLPACEAKEITTSPGKLRLKIGKSSEVIVALKGDDCVPTGNTVTATISKIGSKRIWVTPTSQATDENGQAKFTITAKNKAGNAKVTFMIEDFPNINKTMLVKVR